ncbi:hypothetical protein ETD86_19750 [Nonomuraea turkmeniaca]|uniref:Uncharacterized protein n=1 Tax=Nonomuraea turkmeniaca TaxID=103838 RepID=A0A5S4FJ10_9ACTN|nr:hypothetical protein [Nonomuraea turkmeniaca]TMR19406.1 hypothetical protein ETD86_19750 [Nonomuraea turkmeniaca]
MVGVDQRPRRDQIIEVPLTAHRNTVADNAARRYTPQSGQAVTLASAQPGARTGYTMHRWVRYEAPIMVRVDIDDHTEHTAVDKVVVCIDPDDIHLARDYRGQSLVYDENMEPVHSDTDHPARTALHVAEDRAGWPAADSLDWEDGPDPLRFPDLYDDEDAQDDEDDLEPLDLTDEPARTA